MTLPKARPALGLAALLATLVALGGCLAGVPALTPADGPVFRPDVFFDGRTQGTGTVAIRGRRTRGLRVESVGARQADGSFRLDQTVWVGDDPPRERSWTMAHDGAGGYAATLTDAAGPVRLTVDGGVLEIRYRTGAVTTMHQRLALRPDGQSARNVATVRVLGVPWARIVEEIVRVDARER